MILSMTGFGYASRESDAFKVEVESRSLNSKFLELTLRLPRLIQPYEMEIRSMANRIIKRGKAQVQINLAMNDSDRVKRNINGDLFKSYLKDIERLTRNTSLKSDNLLSVILALPDVMEGNESDLDEESKTLIFESIEESMNKLNEFRAEEGKVLKGELDKYGNEIESRLKIIDGIKNNRIDKISGRINDLFDKHLAPENVDKNRFEQEVLYYIEKLDITEEIVRLKGHIDYYSKEMKSEGSGKKLQFISQEMGREINTIGAKANDKDIQHLVVEMKDELEKIKEQLLNIL